MCDATRWETVASYDYRAHDEQLSDYERLRRRVLFEVWLPDRDSATFEARLCLQCGLIAYAPRPTTADVGAKYRFLQETEKDIGGSAGSARGRDRDRRRAEAILEMVARHRPVRGARVLDFGGGDGKLLQPFLEAGARCSLVDYNVRPLPGIEKLGDTLEEVDPGARFDVIVSSHVFEHLADPRGTLDSLRARLANGGVVFGEVPMEVWKGIPIARDPVTHVNFFTLPSVEELFVRAGMDVVESREGAGTYGGYRLVVARVLATRGSGGGRPSGPDPVAATRRLLAPGLGAELRRTSQTRRLPRAGMVLSRLRALARR